MRVSRFLPVRLDRTVVMTLGAAALMALPAARAYAQDQQAQQPPAAQQPQEDKMKIDADAALIIYSVKPDKTADFESFWTQVKGLYAACDDPQMHQVGTSFKMYKVTTPSAVNYWFIIDPVVKGASYDPTKIIYYVKPGPDANTPGTPLIPRADADALYQKLKDMIVGIAPPVPLSKVGG